MLRTTCSHPKTEIICVHCPSCQVWDGAWTYNRRGTGLIIDPRVGGSEDAESGSVVDSSSSAASSAIPAPSAGTCGMVVSVTATAARAAPAAPPLLCTADPLPSVADAAGALPLAGCTLFLFMLSEMPPKVALDGTSCLTL
jgi:hypothetical protein